jgi:hypothetical protein
MYHIHYMSVLHRLRKSDSIRHPGRRHVDVFYFDIQRDLIPQERPGRLYILSGSWRRPRLLRHSKRRVDPLDADRSQCNPNNDGRCTSGTISP